MSLQDILEHRRAIRYYDPEKPIDPDLVERCLHMSTLAPTSSNMQLWEAYHITDPSVIAQLEVPILGQSTVKTAQQLVVFVVRPDWWKRHAQMNLDFYRKDIPKHFPAEKQEKYIHLREMYYGKIIPFLYRRCFGLWGVFRKIISEAIGLFRPIPRQNTEGEMDISIHKSCALVAQTFMLAMSETGYDTCPLEGFDSTRVKKVLRLPSLRTNKYDRILWHS